MTTDPLADHDVEPLCPDCGTDVFVTAAKGTVYDWRCHFCETRWHA